MQTLRQRTVLMTLLLSAGLIVAACTRTASTQAVPTASGEDGIVPPQGGGGAEATMAAVRSSILTQTAMALLGQGGGEVTETPVPVFPSATPDPGLPTPLPTIPPLPTATPVPPPLPTATFPPVGVPSTYTVQPGEWIYSIARKFGLDPLAIIAVNPGINPNLVYPGQVINLPPPGGRPAAPAAVALPRPTSYTVVRGDWLYSIARKCSVTTEALIAANPSLRPPYAINPGQVLNIP